MFEIRLKPKIQNLFPETFKKNQLQSFHKFVKKCRSFYKLRLFGSL
ncbi:hypothetical protein LEP1GSC133_2246 [Leptospira borgpetersenii serovar Pomona str. 200901868]|uniref:Uncharacterized protein n=1 Tax=Leptospira borgpetersenii serovar Pomona str. 200901868 TaxID=1192866 RepID=M6WNC1_LEPBO|nr:hypothetical protein LEP1GSC133_2246 [Leptospira borgpetersenii serovar Pomona str. 200901868]